MLNRRNLINQSLKFIALAPFAIPAVRGWAQAKKKAESAKPNAKPASNDVNMIDPEKDPVAKALKYTHDASKATRPDKMGVKGADQFCDNCQLYTKQGDDYGKCSMLAAGMVKDKGWCTSWIKKA